MIAHFHAVNVKYSDPVTEALDKTNILKIVKILGQNLSKHVTLRFRNKPVFVEALGCGGQSEKSSSAQNSLPSAQGMPLDYPEAGKLHNTSKQIRRRNYYYGRSNWFI